MDSNVGQIPGMDLPQSSGGQNVPAAFPAVPGSGGHGTAAGGAQQGSASVALPIEVADEPASDDELDQEWVNRAKDVVERTKSDPYTQSNELNKVKAEYLKARFNKDFNVSNSASK